MSRHIPRVWSTTTLLAMLALPVAAGGGMAVARTPQDGCGSAATQASARVIPAGVATATEATAATWVAHRLPGGSAATDQHLVVTGSRTAALVYRQDHILHVALTTDGGETWPDVQQLIDPDQAARRLAVGGSGTTIDLLSDLRYQRSEDGGVTWSTPRNLATHAVHAAIGRSESTVVAAWWTRAALVVRVSHDGGRHFDAARTLTAWDPGDGCALEDPPEVRVLVAGSTVMIVTRTPEGGIVRSLDGGRTWRILDPGWIGAVAATDGERILAATLDGGVRLSTDGGRTWSAPATVAGEWVSQLAWAGGRWRATWEAGGRIHYADSATGRTWTARAVVGWRNDEATDLGFLAGRPVLVRDGRLSARPNVSVPKEVQLDPSGARYAVHFQATGSFTATAVGLTAGETTTGTIDDDPDHNPWKGEDGLVRIPVDVPAGALLLRVQQDAAAVTAGTDLDLYLRRGGSEVASSLRKGSSEWVELALPEPGRYEVLLHGYNTAGGAPSPYRLRAWVVTADPSDGLTVQAPAQGVAGASGTVRVIVDDLASGRWLGAIVVGGRFEAQPTIVRLRIP